jgi:hypothetical protein
VVNLNIGNKDKIHLRLDKKDIRKSSIHKLLTDNLIAIEQTLPPLNTDYINHIILLTFHESEDKNKHLDFEAKITELDFENKIILLLLRGTT